ncbi:MAG: HlyD family type I secretion periplasmic adaptor subunit [Pseudomonadota bacterium]
MRRKPDAAPVPTDGVNQVEIIAPGRAAARRPSRRALKDLAAERAFMPAAMEIMDTPPNPAGRAVALTIAAMFVLAVVWASYGKIDIVAVAQGRVAPVGGVKLVQASAISTVRAIHVGEGQHVEAGALLVELDATETEVDIDQLMRRRDEAGLEAARLDAFIRAMEGEDDGFAPEAGVLDASVVAMHRARLASDLASYRSERDALRAEADRRAAEVATTEAEIAKMRELTPILKEREATVRSLMDQGHTPKIAWQEAQARLIDATHEATVKQYKKAEAENSLKAARMQIEGLSAKTLQTAYAGLADARETLASADLALRKAYQRQSLLQLRAPVAGTVHRLTAKTVGGVIQPVEPVLMIVPEDAALEIQAQVLNRDKGVVAEGQRAEIKFEAFDFTRYGTLEGDVTAISNDALESGEAGLVYEARVTLDADAITVDGALVPLTPGMTASVEIKTGQRRVIDFLFSPLIRYRDEAIRER